MSIDKVPARPHVVEVDVGWHGTGKPRPSTNTTTYSSLLPTPVTSIRRGTRVLRDRNIHILFGDSFDVIRKLTVCSPRLSGLDLMQMMQ